MISASLLVGLLSVALGQAPPAEPPRANPPVADPGPSVPRPADTRLTFPSRTLPPTLVTPPGEWAPDPRPAVARPALAKSGRIELRAISIHRALVAGTPRSNFPPRMTLDLQIAPKELQLRAQPMPLVISRADVPPTAPMVRRGEPLLVRMDGLAPIKDDSGQLLSTKERLDAMPMLHEDVNLSNDFPADDNMSFSMALVLDAPARTATKIPLIRGKVVVSKRKLIPLGFKDLAAMDGRPLEHPKLKDFEIRATVKTQERSTLVNLKLPAHHSRVLVWGLAKDGQMLPGNPLPSPLSSQPMAIPSRPEFGPPGFANPPSLFPTLPGGGEPMETKAYDQEAAKGSILGIALREAVLVEEFPFEFKDVELP